MTINGLVACSTLVRISYSLHVIDLAGSDVWEKVIWRGNTRPIGYSNDSLWLNTLRFASSCGD